MQLSSKGEQYKALKKDILLSIEKKRLKESQILPLLEKLFYFEDLDINDLLFLKELINNDSSKVRLYINYFMSCLHNQVNPIKEETRNVFTDIALNNITNSNTSRVIQSLRILAGLTSKNDRDAPLYKALSELIRTQDVNDTKSDFKQMKKRSSTKNLSTTLSIQSESFCVARSHFPIPDINIMTHAVKGLNAKDNITARHSAYLVYQYTKIEHEATMRLLKSLLGANNSITSSSKEIGIEAASASIHRKDETVRYYWTKICGELASSKETGYELFLQEVYEFIFDISHRVAFSAFEEILKGDWASFEKAMVSDIENTNKQVSVLSVIIERLKVGITSNITPLAHRAAYITRILGERYIQHIEGTSVSLTSSSSTIPPKTNNVDPTKEPLYEIKNNILTLIENTKSQSTKLQALCALIWLTTSPFVKEIEDIIFRECQDLPQNLIDRIFKDLLNRAKISSLFIDIMLDLFYNIYKTVPAKFNIKILMSTWKRIMKIGEKFRFKVLLDIFKYLETPHRKESKHITDNIQKTIYWFLGERANVLTGERCATIPANCAFVDQSNTIQLSINASMEAIVNKLEQAILLSSWETRLVCLEALAKIAFLSSYPVRIRIYEFLLKCSKEDHLCIYHVVIHILKALERIFLLRKTWVKVYDYGKGFKSDQQKKAFLKEIKDCKSIIDPFCDMKDQNPIGPELNSFIESFRLSNKSKKKKKA